jgi:hypothetical protein
MLAPKLMTRAPQMESMTITVIDVTGTTAVVRAVSRRRVGDEPEAIITLQLRLPAEATKSAARDVALKYLDPA